MNQTTETTNVTATSSPITASKSKFAPDSPWRDREGIAARYGKSIRQITDWQKEKVIPFVREGRNVIFHIHKCDKALERFEIKSIGA